MESFPIALNISNYYGLATHVQMLCSQLKQCFKYNVVDTRFVVCNLSLADRLITCYEQCMVVEKSNIEYVAFELTYATFD